MSQKIQVKLWCKLINQSVHPLGLLEKLFYEKMCGWKWVLKNEFLKKLSQIGLS